MCEEQACFVIVDCNHWLHVAHHLWPAQQQPQRLWRMKWQRHWGCVDDGTFPQITPTLIFFYEVKPGINIQTDFLMDGMQSLRSRSCTTCDCVYVLPQKKCMRQSLNYFFCHLGITLTKQIIICNVSWRHPSNSTFVLVMQ